jgi:hypothetical protein
VDIDPEFLGAWERHSADWPEGQPRELRTLLRRVPLDLRLPVDDGDVRFERLDVYEEGCLLRFQYLRRREDGAPRGPAMRLGDAPRGGIWFEFPDPGEADPSDAGVPPEFPPAWFAGGDFPPRPEATVVVTDDRGNRYEGMPSQSGGNEEEYHFTHRIAQPLDPEASELYVELTELIWTHFPAPDAPGGGSTMVIDRVQRGPGPITVSLRGGTSSSQ